MAGRSLFARRTAPREVAPFVARQLLTMPDPLRSGLATAPGRLLFSEITGQRRRPRGWRPATRSRRAGSRC